MKKQNHLYKNSILFFLKNIWLSPSVNYLYVVLGVLILVLKIGQDLSLNDIFLAMLFISLTAYCVNRVIIDKHRRITPWFSLLPMSTIRLLQLFFVSALFYSVIVQGLLILLLHVSSGLPFIGDPSVSLVETGSGDVISVISGYMIDMDNNEVPYQKSLRPSLVFGIVRSMQGYPLFPHWHIILFLFFVSSTLYHIVFHHLTFTSPQTVPVVHLALCGSSIAIGIIAISDFLLPGKQVWMIRSQLDKVIWVIPVVFTVLTFLMVSTIYRKVSRLHKENEVMP